MAQYYATKRWNGDQIIPISSARVIFSAQTAIDRNGYHNAPDIVTLTINPAIDIFVSVSRVEPTRKLRASALAAGKALEQAFRVAVAAGSAAVLSPGTELCREQDVMRLLPEVRISEVEAAVT